MKTPKLIVAVALGLFFLFSQYIHAQCRHTIKIDGTVTQVDEIPAGGGLHLPSWLAAAQTIAVDQNVNSISVIEFTVNGTSLDFSRVVSVTTVQTVPAGKVWKVEAVHNAI